MPGVLQDALRELFARRPELLAPLVRPRLSLPWPGLVAIDSDEADPRPKAEPPDAVLACPDPDAPALIVIVEVQLRVDEARRRLWPQHAAETYARHRCPVVTFVVTPSSRVERWARRAIEVGPRHAMTPEVLGPSGLPPVDAAAVKRAPVVGLLSTLAHAGDPECAEQALETLEVLASWDEDADGRLAAGLEAALPAGVRARMEALMRAGTYEYQSEFAKQCVAHGREQGQAHALLLVLRARSVDVPVEAERRIQQERDVARLEAWIRRAATATTIDDVFAGP